MVNVFAGEFQTSNRWLVEVLLLRDKLAQEVVEEYCGKAQYQFFASELETFDGLMMEVITDMEAMGKGVTCIHRIPGGETKLQGTLQFHFSVQKNRR